jgi:hypothetical protein
LLFKGRSCDRPFFRVDGKTSKGTALRAGGPSRVVVHAADASTRNGCAVLRCAAARSGARARDAAAADPVRGRDRRGLRNGGQ